MDIRMIKTFQTVVKMGSFQKAAELLKYSQPTVTVHVKKLEEELEVELLVRGKSMKLTEAGRLFYERSESLLREYDFLHNSMVDFRQGDAGLIRIGGSEPWISQFMPSLLPAFVAHYPKVQISVINGNSRKLSEMLLNDQVDFAVCTEPEPSPDIDFERLLLEPMAVLLPDNHPLVQEPIITVESLSEEKFLKTMGSCPIRVKVESIIASRMNRHSHESIEVSNITALKYYVQAQLGIALAPIVAVSPEIPGTLLRLVADMNEGFQIGILQRRFNPPQGKAVLSLLAEVRRFLIDRHAVTQQRFT